MDHLIYWISDLLDPTRTRPVINDFYRIRSICLSQSRHPVLERFELAMAIVALRRLSPPRSIPSLRTLARAARSSSSSAAAAPRSPPASSMPARPCAARLTSPRSGSTSSRPHPPTSGYALTMASNSRQACRARVPCRPPARSTRYGRRLPRIQSIYYHRMI